MSDIMLSVVTRLLAREELGGVLSGIDILSAFAYLFLFLSIVYLRTCKRDASPPLKKIFLFAGVFICLCGFISLVSPFATTTTTTVSTDNSNYSSLLSPLHCICFLLYHTLKLSLILFTLYSAISFYQMGEDFFHLPTSHQLLQTNTELYSTRDNLKTANKELHSTRDDLKTANDELHSARDNLETANRELHSTSDNLNAINRALHSTKDILKTANRARDDLKVINSELQQGRDNLERVVAQRTYEMRQDNARWHLVAEQSPQILFLKDMDGRVVFYNKKWYQYTGLSPEDDNKCDAVHPNDSASIRQKWIDCYEHKEGFEWKIRLKSRDNNYRWHLLRCDPLRDVETQEVIQYCGISTDIHDTEMIKELSVADASRKSRFLAMISHEMRTPLAGIIGMSTLLGDTELQPLQADILNDVKASSDKLLVLVNNILDLFKIQNNKLRLELSIFELADCVHGAVALVKEEATRKKITIHDEIAHDMMPSLIRADPERLKQILGNLLSNAVKFTQDGGDIYISAVLEDSDSRSKIKFSVRDTGIGIQNKYILKVFETFSQLDSSSTRMFGGTGVGLAISKGATFFFTFEMTDVTNEGIKSTNAPFISRPLLYTSSSDDIMDPNGVIIRSMLPNISDNTPVSPPCEGEPVCIGNPRVLVVDDNEMNQKVLKRTLGNLGFNNVEVVLDGAQAVNVVSNSLHSFDIIFMDVEMPVMDGITSTKTIRRLPLSVLAKQPHIVAVTANALQEDVAECLDAGMCLHMAKPLKKEDLKKQMVHSLQIICGNEACFCNHRRIHETVYSSSFGIR